MSGKSTVAVTAASQAAGSRTARPEASARWAALDSRHERLVTASDAVLAEPVLAETGRWDDRRIAS